MIANNSSILNYFSVTEDSQLVSSMDTINQAVVKGGGSQHDIDSLSYTHVPMMPDIYLPFSEMERCPQLELLPSNYENEDSKSALLKRRKERRAERKQKRIEKNATNNDSVSFLTSSQINDGNTKLSPQHTKSDILN